MYVYPVWEPNAPSKGYPLWGGDRREATGPRRTLPYSLVRQEDRRFRGTPQERSNTEEAGHPFRPFRFQAGTTPDDPLQKIMENMGENH